MYNYMYNLEKVVHDAEVWKKSKLPREAIDKIIGNLIRTEGVVLEKDTVPAIDKAALLFNTRKQIGSCPSLQVWYFTLLRVKRTTYLNANGNR